MSKEMVSMFLVQVVIFAIRAITILWFPATGYMAWLGWKQRKTRTQFRYTPDYMEYAIVMLVIGLVVACGIWYIFLPATAPTKGLR